MNNGSEHNTDQLECSSQSSNFNQIEILWDYLKIQIHCKTPQDIQQLKTICKEELNKISHETCHSLVKNYRKRFVAVEQKKLTVQSIKTAIFVHIFSFHFNILFFMMKEYFFHHQICNNT